MTFKLPDYKEPDFNTTELREAPIATFVPAPAGGVAPDNYHATSNHPEYVKVDRERWLLCAESRMDCVITRSGDTLQVKEFRNVSEGEPVLTGRRENGEDGIYVHTDGFERTETSTDKFQFKTRATRETPFSYDYDFLYDLLHYEKEKGFITWVMGPAATFDMDSRSAMEGLIRAGYCHAIMAGNALAAHDLEVSYLGTALGQDIYDKSLKPLGHYNHLDTINKIRGIGSIEKAIKDLNFERGIIKTCLDNNVPFILAGSIRDDGPLPGVIADVYESQDRMRSYARKSTTVIALATQLHSIAFGNMIPSYHISGEKPRPVFFYVVDISEFAVDKLANRGSFQVRGISTNVQDFVVNCARALVG